MIIEKEKEIASFYELLSIIGVTILILMQLDYFSEYKEILEIIACLIALILIYIGISKYIKYRRSRKY